MKTEEEKRRKNKKEDGRIVSQTVLLQEPGE